MVFFPYSIDYMLDNNNANTFEFISLGETSASNLEHHIKQFIELYKSHPGEQTIKVTTIGFKDIRVEHLN